MYRYFFCDIDRTLLDSEGNLPSYNLEAIKKARKKGMHFIVTSGRAAFSALEVAKMVGIKEDEIVISNNGADFFNFKGEFIKHTPFPKEVSDIVIDYLLSINVALRVFLLDKSFDYRMKELCDRFDKSKLKDVDRETLVYGLSNRIIEKISLSYRDDIDPDLLANTLRDITGNRIECSYFKDSYYMETNYVNQSKGKAIIDFCKERNVPLNEVIVMGDTYNDQTMFDIGAFNTSPANAVEGIKKISDYVSKRDNNQGAVGEVIYKIVLGENDEI